MRTPVRLSALILAASLVIFCGAAANSAGADPPGVRAFHLPTCGLDTSLIAGPKRGVLLALCDEKSEYEGTVVANLLPDGRRIRYHLPRSAPGPMAVGPDGSIWAVRTLDAKSFPTYLYRLEPDGTRERFSIDQFEPTPQGYAEFRIRDLVVDRNGTAWLATAYLENYAYIYRSFGGELIRIAPGGPAESFPLPQGEPENLAVGADGNLWFTAIAGRYGSEHSFTPGTGIVGRLTPAGAFTLFPTPIAHGEPEAVASAPDGKLWFTEPAVGRIGTVGLDGTFGRDHRVRFGDLANPWIIARQGGLVFDPGVGALIPSPKVGVGILKPRGARSRVRGPREAQSVAVGREGAIWSLGGEEVSRVAPVATG